MTEHSYKYSITRITDDITTVVETDDRAFAYEFTHGIPEIEQPSKSEPYLEGHIPASFISFKDGNLVIKPLRLRDEVPDCTNLSIDESASSGDYPVPPWFKSWLERVEKNLG